VARGRLVVDRVDGDRDRLDRARLGGGAAGVGGAAVFRGAPVGARGGEGVGAVVVGVRGVVDRGAGSAERAVAGAGDDRVGQVGVGGLEVGDEGAEVDRGRSRVFVQRLRAVARGRRVVDRVDGDRDRLDRARLGGVAAGAGSAAVIRVAPVGDRVGEGVGAV